MKTKRDLIYLLAIIFLLGICGQFWYSYKYQPTEQHEIKIYYNQERQLNKEIIDLTREADKYVYFAVYTFTRTDIKDALLAAKYRGLDVRGITDRDQYKGLEPQKKIIDELVKAGIPVATQDHLGIMHLKVIVTDKGFASGSFNWTASATNINDEVLEVGREAVMRDSYKQILEKLFAQNKPLPQE